MASQISEQEFLTIYAKNPANKFTRFMYKNFGVTNNNKFTLCQWLLLIIFGVFNILGFITSIIPIVLFPNIVLAIVVICGFIAVFMNNFRIRKIRKELNITQEEYDIYVNIYMKN